VTEQRDIFWRKDAALNQIIEEFNVASLKFPPFHSAHEGFSVLKEEVDELWDEVKGHRSIENFNRMRAEAVQVAAMALRFIVDVNVLDWTGNDDR